MPGLVYFDNLCRKLAFICLCRELLVQVVTCHFISCVLCTVDFDLNIIRIELVRITYASISNHTVPHFFWNYQPRRASYACFLQHTWLQNGTSLQYIADVSVSPQKWTSQTGRKKMSFVIGLRWKIVWDVYPTLTVKIHENSKKK
jgi:hypothetical protein